MTLSPNRRPSRPFVAAATLGLVLLMASTHARAQNDDPQLAEARGHFDAGQAHYDAGRYALAAQEFERSRELLSALHHPNAALVLFNVGRSYMELGGHDQEARDAYERFLAEATVRPDTREMIELARQHLEELNARLATDGGHPPRPPPGASAAEGGVSPVGPILLGVGGALAIAGAVIGGVALAMDSDLMTACGPAMVCPDSERSRVSDLQALGIAADSLLFGGLGVAAVGLVLLLVLREGAPDAQARLRFTCGSRGCTTGGEVSF